MNKNCSQLVHVISLNVVFLIMANGAKYGEIYI